MTRDIFPAVTLKRLVKKAQAGDAAAFEALCRPCSATLYRVASSCLAGREAEVADALQETLMAAWKAIGSLRQPRYFKTWLVRICINSCRQLQRKQRPAVSLETVGEKAIEDALRAEGRRDDTARAVAEAESNAAFKRLVEAAGDSSALVITLYYGEGYATDEIAALLALTPEAVRQRLMRGRRRIAEALSEPPDDEGPHEPTTKSAAPGRPGQPERPRAPGEEGGPTMAASPV